jgi:hypothetical protein
MISPTLSLSINTENGKLVQVRSNVRKEDTDLIQVFRRYRFGYSS